MLPTELLISLLGVGGAAMIAAIVQAYRSIRDGAKVDEKDAFSAMESNWGIERRRAERAIVERDYWHQRSATLEYVIRTHLGPDAVPVFDPLPPDDPNAAGES